MIKKPRITVQRLQYARRALLAFVCWYSLPASAATVYFNDFQGAVGSEWSNTSIASSPNPDYNGTRLFLGEFGNGTVSLSLTGLPEHAFTTVSFSLYLIRSWDGNDTTVVNGDPLGHDNWTLNVAGGPSLLNTTFSNGNPAGQAYSPSPGATSCNPGYNAVMPAGVYNPMTGASECYSLGYTFTDSTVTNEAMDSVYELTFTFAHADSSILLNFGANGLQSLADESWGLDNVRVQVSAVPIPAAVWLFGSGLLGLIGVARRKKAA